MGDRCRRARRSRGGGDVVSARSSGQGDEDGAGGGQVRRTGSAGPGPDGDGLLQSSGPSKVDKGPGHARSTQQRGASGALAWPRRSSLSEACRWRCSGTIPGHWWTSTTDRPAPCASTRPGWSSTGTGTSPPRHAGHTARTKGKTESGIKYVKRNALAGRDFDSFGALERHLEEWMAEADARVHGTTHERPLDRFECEEKAALRPLPSRPLPRRQQRLKRKVANDALVDVDTVRYSVPHRLVRKSVEMQVGEQQVRIFHAGKLVATHCYEARGRPALPAHPGWTARPCDATGSLAAAAESDASVSTTGRARGDGGWRAGLAHHGGGRGGRPRRGPSLPHAPPSLPTYASCGRTSPFTRHTTLARTHLDPHWRRGRPP